MSVEEDIELKNLVAQTLENKGILPKIRAELRANVFLALEENPTTKEIILKNEELSAFLKIPIGALILNLIREFLEFFELEFTLSVFEPETKYEKEYHKIERDKMINELKIIESNTKFPLLYNIIERIINDSKVAISDNNLGVSHINDLSESRENENNLPSPIPLNLTFVKKPDIDSTSVSPVQRENDINESIKEELISNSTSDLDSLSESKVGVNQISVLKTSSKPLDENSKESRVEPLNTISKDTIEIDFLTFTPVKETESKEKSKALTVPKENNELKTDGKKEAHKSMAVLSDLPPLTTQSDEKEFNINEIKAIIDEWSGKTTSSIKDEGSVYSKSSKNELCDDKSSVHLKSEIDYSQKSENTEVDDFEEDISDLLNGHTPLDSQHTVDETVSQATCAADYLESL